MVEWRVVTERFVEADGCRLFVRESGTGPPVLLLHGFPETGACWRRVAGLLAPRHRVLVPDLPGYGRSGRPRAFDAGTIARTIAGAMETAGAPRAVVVGHDWGGSISFRLTLDHPERVERLVVINAPFRKLDLRRAWYMLAFNVPVVPELALTLSGDRWVDRFLRAGAADPAAFAPEDLAEYRRAYRPLERKRAALAYYRTVTRRALRRRVGGGSGPRRTIDRPTIIVWGERDPALPVSLLDGIERDIPGVRIERIPDAGHFVPEERPERVAELIESFGG